MESTENVAILSIKMLSQALYQQSLVQTLNGSVEKKVY